jgi:hypothetical protein
LYGCKSSILFGKDAGIPLAAHAQLPACLRKSYSSSGTHLDKAV